MYKLCFALAFLAVAAAKPSWPVLSYSSYPAAVPSVYHTAVHHQSYVPSVPAAYSAVYSAPAYQTYPVVTKTYTAPIATSQYVTSVVKPVVAAPVVTAPFAPAVAVSTNYAYPTTYSASVAPISGYAYGSPASFVWKKK